MAERQTEAVAATETEVKTPSPDNENLLLTFLAFNCSVVARRTLHFHRTLCGAHLQFVALWRIRNISLTFATLSVLKPLQLRFQTHKNQKWVVL